MGGNSTVNTEVLICKQDCLLYLRLIENVCSKTSDELPESIFTVNNVFI